MCGNIILLTNDSYVYDGNKTYLISFETTESTPVDSYTLVILTRSINHTLELLTMENGVAFGSFGENNRLEVTGGYDYYKLVKLEGGEDFYSVSATYEDGSEAGITGDKYLNYVYYIDGINSYNLDCNAFYFKPLHTGYYLIIYRTTHTQPSNLRIKIAIFN